MGPEKYIKEAFEGQATETNGEELARTEEDAQRLGEHIANAKWMAENAKTPEEKAKAEQSLAALESKAESTDEHIEDLQERNPDAVPVREEIEEEDNVPTAVSDSAVIDEPNVPTPEPKPAEEAPVEYVDPISGQSQWVSPDEWKQMKEAELDLTN